MGAWLVGGSFGATLRSGKFPKSSATVRKTRGLWLGRELAVESLAGQILQTDTVDRKMSERWWITLAVVLVAVWICQSSVDASSLRNRRHQGSRRSRADPNRPVSLLSTAVFYNNSLFMRAGKTVNTEQSRVPPPGRDAWDAEEQTACEIRDRYSLPFPFSSLPSSLPFFLFTSSPVIFFNCFSATHHQTRSLYGTAMSSTSRRGIVTRYTGNDVTVTRYVS